MHVSYCGAETLATATAVAVELSHRLTAEQMNNLGNLLTVIGDELILLAGYRVNMQTGNNAAMFGKANRDTKSIPGSDAVWKIT